MQPNGSKWWRFRYDWDGKEQMLSMGTYPGTSLANARKRRDDARQKIEAGTDPGAQHRLTEGAPERTFEAVAPHYLAGLERKVLLKKRSPHTLRKARWALRDYIHPYLGSKPIDSISSQDLLVILRRCKICRTPKGRSPHELRNARTRAHPSNDRLKQWAASFTARDS